MKNLCLILLICLFSISKNHAQVGIGTTTPEAALDIRSSNQATPTNTDGLLIPKINNFPTTNPTAAQDGMMVYVTGSGAPAKGFYYWDQAITNWVTVKSADSGWQETGNAGTNPTTNFIGTTDAQDLSFRTNTIEKMRLTEKGQLEFFNTGSSVFIGEGAGENDNLSANENTFVGTLSGTENTSGDFNSYFGYQAGTSMQNVFGNSAFGHQALAFSGGQENTVIGHKAGLIFQGNFNTLIGSRAGETSDNVTSNFNIFIGQETAPSFDGGDHNIAFGFLSLGNTSGNENVAIGKEAMIAGGGESNIAIGSRAMRFAAGNNNIAIGSNALENDPNVNPLINNNIAIGHQAGQNTGALSSSIFIGNQAGQSFIGFSNGLVIHNSNSINPLIYGEFDNRVLGFNGNVAINHQAPQAALHVEENGTANQQTIVAALESSTSNRPLLLFSESTTIDLTAGMSLEYNGVGSGNANKLVFNAIGGTGLFEFENGGDLKVLSGDIIIETTAGDRELRMGDNAGNNDRVMLRQAGTDDIFIGDIDNNGGDFNIRTGGSTEVTVLSGSGNVGLGTTNPVATIDMRASNQATPLNTDGMLIPKIDNFPTTNPTAAQDGMMVYATGTGTPAKGFYNWDQALTNWITVNSDFSWSETGNAGTNSATNFIGTLDAQDLSFRSNTIEKLRLTQKGQLAFLNTGNSVFIGENSGANDDLTDNFNTYVGHFSGRISSVNGENNSYFGAHAGEETVGFFNSYFGSFAGSASGGANNTYLGFRAGANSGSDSSTFIGSRAGELGTDSNVSNIFIGAESGTNFSLGDENVAIGNLTINHAFGGGNVVIGSRALRLSEDTNDSVVIGAQAAENVPAIAGSVIIGNQVGQSLGVISNKLIINNEDSPFPLIYGEFDNLIVGFNAYVAVGHQSPQATLDIRGVSQASPEPNDGMLIPRVDNFSITAPTAAQDGMMVYATGIGTPSKGFYNWDQASTNWVNISGTSGSGWSQTGDAGTNPITNFIGTTDAQDLSFRTNNIEKMRLTQTGLHVIENGTANQQTIVSALESSTSNRPLLLFSESTTIDLTAGMSIEYNGIGTGSANKLVFNAIGGVPLFDFTNGGNFTAISGNITALSGNITTTSGDFIIGTTAGDREFRMGDNAGNNDRVMLRQAGTDHIFIGDIDNNGGNFTIRTGGADAVTVLSGSRNVGIGTTTPTHQLQLSTNSAAKPTSGLWTIASDRRLKKDVSSFNDGLETLKAINPVWFTYNGLANMPIETGVGTIAQELQEVAPYLVKDWTYTEDDGTTENYLGVNYGPLTFIMVNAIKEQAKDIDRLTSQLEEQQNQYEAKLRSLEERLTRLEN